MDINQFDELAGRIDGIGQALLRLTAELEVQSLIDGSRVSAAWTQVAQQRLVEGKAVSQAAHVTLLQLAGLLDDARAARQSRWIPG